jgi:YlmC/YmxH family sporulation protein
MVETSFFDLRCKEVINIVDGKCLGHICDIIIDICCGKVLGIVVPTNKSMFNIFKGSDEIFIPYKNICKIGQDTILIELSSLSTIPYNSSILSKKDDKNVSAQTVVPDDYINNQNNNNNSNNNNINNQIPQNNINNQNLQNK